MIFVAIGCGNGSSGSSGGGNDMAMNGGGGDGGMPDLSTSGTVMNMGTQIMQATQLIGLTADDQALAYTGAKGLSAVTLDGKTKTVIDANATSAVISGKVVFTWDLASASVTTSDTVYVWKAGATPRKITLAGATAASLAGTGAATADGSWILYADNSIDGGNTDVYVSKFDGTGAIKIASNAQTSNPMCGVNGFGFGDKLFLFHCDTGMGGDAGITGAKLTMFNTTTMTTHELSADATTFGSDKMGKVAYFLDSTKQLWFVDLNAGTPMPAMVRGATAVNTAYISRDGSTITWTNANGLSLAPITPTPVAVGAPLATIPNILDFLASAPDDSSALVSDIVTDPKTNQSDIILLTKAAPSSPTTLVTGGKGVLYGPAYSPDAKTVFFYDNPANPGVADLHFQPVAGGNKTDVETKVWSHVLGVGKIAYNNNYKMGASATANGKADIWIYDIASGMKTQISSAAVAAPAGGLFTSSDNKTLVYDYQPSTAAQKGVYTYSLQ